MTERGAIIALEGPEGAGKSVQIERLAAWLGDAGHSCLTTREPGGTPTGEAIREAVWRRPDLEIDGITELLLLSAVRHAHVREVVLPAVERGVHVLMDRFELSTRAYQGYGRGVDLAMIEDVTRVATGGLLPDVYIVLDVAPDLGARRQAEAGLTPDRIEREKAEFMARVRRGYREMCAADERCVLIDGAGTPDDVQRRIREIVLDRIPRLRGGP